LRNVLSLLVLCLACSEAPADRAAYTFFDAMRQGDASRMAMVLDSAVYRGQSGVLELDTLMPGADLKSRRNRILMELTGGNLKRIWLSKQIIVGHTERAGDTDWVEVSFVDQERELHYLTSFGLLKKGKTWRIFSFKRV